MIALVTGASSGIGRDIARSLAKHGINVIITARRRDRLEELKKELTETYGVKVHIIAADISDMAQCRELHRRVKKYSIDIFVNNAGLGVFGDFTDTDLDRELAELDVNVKAFHTLFKLFLQDFRKRDYGYILNTASSAGFFPGPHFSSYYDSGGSRGAPRGAQPCFGLHALPGAGQHRVHGQGSGRFHDAAAVQRVRCGVCRKADVRGAAHYSSVAGDEGGDNPRQAGSGLHSCSFRRAYPEPPGKALICRQ